jgi:hypothetical protein
VRGRDPAAAAKGAVEVQVPEGLMGEFDLMMQELLVGKRTRLDTLEQEFKAIEVRGLRGLSVILTAIRSRAGTGQAGGSCTCWPGSITGMTIPSICRTYVRWTRYWRMRVWTISITTGWPSAISTNTWKGRAGVAGVVARLWGDSTSTRLGCSVENRET